MCLKSTGCVANSSEWPRSVMSDLGLHSLLMSVSPLLRVDTLRVDTVGRSYLLNCKIFTLQNKPIQIYRKFYHQKMKIFR